MSKKEFPYRIKTLRELAATCDRENSGIFYKDDNNCFTRAMHHLADMPLKTNKKQQVEGWFIEPWMITKNTSSETTAPKPKVSKGDKITFDLGTHTLEYTVDYSHLRNDGPSDNETIFKDLGIKDKAGYCTKVYGYESRGGDFPEFKSGDYEAASRIIEALQRECAKFREKKSEPVERPRNYKEELKNKIKSFVDKGYPPSRIFNELFGFEMPDDQFRIFYKDTSKDFCRHYFFHNFCNPENPQFAHPDYLIYEAWDVDERDNILKDLAEGRFPFSLQKPMEITDETSNSYSDYLSVKGRVQNQVRTYLNYNVAPEEIFKKLFKMDMPEGDDGALHMVNEKGELESFNFDFNFFKIYFLNPNSPQFCNPDYLISGIWDPNTRYKILKAIDENKESVHRGRITITSTQSYVMSVDPATYENTVISLGSSPYTELRMTGDGLVERVKKCSKVSKSSKSQNTLDSEVIKVESVKTGLRKSGKSNLLKI